jgi:hypothetical protein
MNTATASKKTPATANAVAMIWRLAGSEIPRNLNLKRTTDGSLVPVAKARNKQVMAKKPKTSVRRVRYG